MIARRNAHTLLELMAVIAILVVVAAIGLPLVKPMLYQRNEQAAVDVVRARFSQLKSKAVNDGRAYCFQYQSNTRSFRCIVDADEAFEDEDHWEEKGDLPGDGDVKFDNKNDGESKDGWVTVASFLPDNTAKQYILLKFGHDEIPVHGATKSERNK